MSTVNGIGTFYYGADEPGLDGSRIATEFIVFFFFPLLPLKTRRIRKSNVTGSRMQIEVLESLPLRWSQIGRTFLRVWLGVPALVAGPLALEFSVMYYLHHVRGVQFEGTVLDKIVLPLCLGTVVYSIFMAAYLLGRARRA